MEREATLEVQQLREENRKLWDLVEILKNTNNNLIQTYILNSSEKETIC